MSKYRNKLPQLNGDIYLTDSGFETTIIFKDGFDLPEFAAFPLINDEKSVKRIYDYYKTHIQIAAEKQLGFILESLTWRASNEWGKKLGFDDAMLYEANHKIMKLLSNLRDEHETDSTRLVISGCIGPRFDGYVISKKMTTDEAFKYHSVQIKTLSETDADMITALTLNYVEEAIGVALSAKANNIPVVISFTTETDGNLPTGMSLREAIGKVDEATSNYPSYFMINCAHPTHFEQILPIGENWTDRIRGLRANASKKSHAELDESTELDDGNPDELGASYFKLKEKLQKLNVVGGCCGTDDRHVSSICNALTS